MNSSEAPTDMLKLWICPSIVLHSMKSNILGWWTSITAIFAPSLLPPWVTKVDTEDKCFSTAIGPQALPWVVAIGVPVGLISDKENPVPPPNFWTIAASCAAFIIPSIESVNGRTKHADNVPAPVPAFISVGELGKNSKLAIDW